MQPTRIITTNQIFGIMKTNRLKRIAGITAGIMAALFAASCSSDAFFGFDDDLTNNHYDNNSFKSFANESFISISTSDFRQMTNVDFLNLNTAITRIESDFNKDIAKGSRGYMYNMTDTLFNLAYTVLDNTRKFFAAFSSDNTIKRVKNKNREVVFEIRGTDCVGQAIAYSLYPEKADSINSILANYFPSYNSRGVPYDSIEVAFDLCRANYSSNSQLYTTNTSTSNTSDVLFIEPPKGDYHAMNIISVTYKDNIYTVLAHDKNFDEIEFYTYSDYFPVRFKNNDICYKMISAYHLTKKVTSNNQ